MTIKNLPFISIQPDWEDVVREVASNMIPKGSFWIACYLTGKESAQGSVTVTRTENHEIELEGNDGFRVHSLNSRTFKIEYKDFGVQDITVHSPKKEFSPFEGKEVTCIDISPNGTLFGAGNGSKVKIGSIQEGDTKVTLEGHLSDVTTVQFFPSNLVVLTGGADFQLKIWSVLSGLNPVTLQGHTSAITSTAIISQGRNVLSSSRDGTVKLWNCGTSSVIATIGNYSSPVNKMILAKLPSDYEAADPSTLDPLEVETADKLVIVALDDGSVRGIHLGTKKEVFTISASDAALTAIAYESERGILFTGSKDGLVQIYVMSKSVQVPHLQWKRNNSAITSLATKLSENGEIVLCISTGDGGVYQTESVTNLIGTNDNVRVEVEYSGNELEPVYDMKVISNELESSFQRIACCSRDGKIKIY